MVLRKADRGDESLLRYWREQDEDVSWWEGKKTTRWSHAAWFGDRIVSPIVELYIAEVDGTPCGQCRIDSNGEISFSVDRDYRLHGIGTEMIREATARSRLTRLKANVDRSNRAGIRALGRAGYKIREDVVFLRWPH